MDDGIMGLFAKLPREVRDQIYQELLRYTGDSFTSKREGPEQTEKLGIIYTCRQISEEVTSHLYENKVLHFHISPHYRLQSWLYITNEWGWKVHLCSLDNAATSAFLGIPYQKLKAIKIEIEAPRLRDPGQVICLLWKVRDIVELLLAVQNQVGLPRELEVHLVDSKTSKWSGQHRRYLWKAQYSHWRPGLPVTMPQRSLSPKILNKATGQYEELYGENQFCFRNYDYQTILQPFYLLHDIPKATVHVPDEIAAHLTLSEMMVDFGSSQDNAFWDKDLVQRSLDLNFLQHDRALDRLWGSTASMMRLHRFSTWFTHGLGSESKYLNEIEGTLQDTTTAITFDPEKKAIFTSSLKVRYDWMLLFNPLSAAMQRIEARREQTLRYVENQPARLSYINWGTISKLAASSETALEEEQAESEQDPERNSKWDKKEWHNYYAVGIPVWSDMYPDLFKMLQKFHFGTLD